MKWIMWPFICLYFQEIYQFGLGKQVLFQVVQTSTKGLARNDAKRTKITHWTILSWSTYCEPSKCLHFGSTAFLEMTHLLIIGKLVQNSRSYRRSITVLASLYDLVPRPQGLNSHFHRRGTSSLPTRPLRPTIGTSLVKNKLW